MTASITIPARFNGPPDSANGGFACGVLAAFVGPQARVRLHVPPPLEQPLEVTLSPEGASMSAGDLLVATAVPCELAMAIPPAPHLEAARHASRGFPCFDNHTFPTCFVCGPGRPAHDGLELFPGPVGGWQLLACTWTPGDDLLDEAGRVRPEIVWSALDCPGYFAAMGDCPPAAVLGELEAHLIADVPGGEPLLVYAWPLGNEGRKYYGGTAVADADGRVLACARSTWITLKGPG
jgi:hypothetical protein